MTPGMTMPEGPSENWRAASTGSRGSALNCEECGGEPALDSSVACSARMHGQIASQTAWSARSHGASARNVCLRSVGCVPAGRQRRCMCVTRSLHVRDVCI